MKPQPTILITGAGRDIGQRIAIALASPGAFLLLHYANSEEGARDTLSEVRARGAEGVLLHADFSTLESAQELAGAAASALAGRPLDVLVHNAAITTSSPPGSLHAESLATMMNGNVLVPLLLTDALAPILADRASIIAVSVAATRAVFSPDFSLFTASKAALESLVRHWAIQFGAQGIRANAVAPGVVEVNFRAELLRDQGFRESLEGATALRRVGAPDDVAHIVEFLASARSQWMTGQVLDASGGWRL